MTTPSDSQLHRGASDQDLCCALRAIKVSWPWPVTMLTWGALLTHCGIGAWKISVGRGLPIAIIPVVAILRLSVIACAAE